MWALAGELVAALRIDVVVGGVCGLSEGDSEEK